MLLKYRPIAGALDFVSNFFLPRFIN